jgi:hypothetical protein
MNLRQTNIGPRPDLAKLECNWPTGYIGPRIFPVSMTTEKANSFTYRGFVADAAPESGRSAVAALAMTQLTNASGSYSCVKREKRYVASEDDCKETGGIERMDAVGAKASKRSLMRAFEDAAYAKLFSAGNIAAAFPMAASNEFAVLNMAANVVRKGFGKLSLVCSQQWLMGFIGLSAVSTRLQSIAGLGGYIAARDAAMSIQPDVLVSMLRTILPFDQILVGDNAHWYTTTNAAQAAVVMLPDVSGDDIIMTAKMEPIYGLSKWFLPDPVGAPDAPIAIDAEWLPTEKLNAWDAYASWDLMELNPTAAKIVTLQAGVVYTTTTTTSTTTTSTSTTTGG